MFLLFVIWRHVFFSDDVPKKIHFQSCPFYPNPLCPLLKTLSNCLWDTSVPKRVRGPIDYSQLSSEQLHLPPFLHYGTLVTQPLSAILYWPVKGILSRDFRTFFWLKRFDLGAIWTGKNGFTTFFVFTEIFDHKVWR